MAFWQEHDDEELTDGVAMPAIWPLSVFSSVATCLISVETAFVRISAKKFLMLTVFRQEHDDEGLADMEEAMPVSKKLASSIVSGRMGFWRSSKSIEG